MSVEIRSLTIGVPAEDQGMEEPNDFFNIIQNQNVVYDLYVVPSTPPMTALISNIRLANTHTSTVQITLYFTRPTLPPNPYPRRRLLTPVNMSLPANSIYVDDHELAMEKGDKIQAVASVGGVIQYLINGVEREVV